LIGIYEKPALDSKLNKEHEFDSHFELNEPLHHYFFITVITSSVQMPLRQAKLWDPIPRENPQHHLSYCWTVLGYSQPSIDHSREAQEVTALRYHETEEWEEIIELEESGNYDPGLRTMLGGASGLGGES